MYTAESGTCDICKSSNTILNRKYYYYNIKCDCCNSKNDNHFHIIRHCSLCFPKPPSSINVVLKPILEDNINILLSNIE